MSSLLVMPTVNPKMLFIVAAMVNASKLLNIQQETVITSGNDGHHMDGSKHYSYDAVDFRSHHLDMTQKLALCAEVKRRLGQDYDVILEERGMANEHIHIEYDPKLRGTVKA